jgi:LysM repeat protein
MTQKIRFCSVATIIALVLSACALPTDNNRAIADTPLAPAIQLTVSANTATPFNAVGQVVDYTYLVKNTGTASYPGPVSITDNKAAITCPGVNTVGNADDNLDVNEEIACTGTYTITQADLDSGSVTNTATATVSGSSSAPVTTATTLTQNQVLTLTKAANPTTYDQVSQVITYTYVILNTGNVTLQGPFSITDDKAAANCTQPDDNLLSPNEEMSCTASYNIAQADLDAGLVTNNAAASNGIITSANATTTVTKTGTSTSPIPPFTTQSHTVVKGEWLWQIARCYGAEPKEVIRVNAQFPNPAKIPSGVTVTVPNVGSAGTIYGPPCIHSYTVVSGDNWDSIAKQFSNVDPLLLQEANPGGLVPGNTIRVPVGPYNYP